MLHFRAFENLWKSHRMNKAQQRLNTEAKFDNGEMDVYNLSEDQLWASSELEEMRKPKSSKAKKSPAVSIKTEDVEEEETAAKMKTSRAQTQGTNSATESSPDFYHGVGPFNDINFPGVWFFRIPHKVWATM